MWDIYIYIYLVWGLWIENEDTTFHIRVLMEYVQLYIM